MKLAVIFSGDIESIKTVSEVIKEKHEIKYLAVIHSKNPDDYIFHTPNLGLTLFQAESMGFQLVSKESKNEEDLKILLRGLDIEGVACGVVSNKNKKQLIEKACKELNLKLLTPLWKINKEKLLKESVKDSYEIIITAINEKFDEEWLGRNVDEKCVGDLIELSKKSGINVLGENGEYESLVLDCRLFTRKILITQVEKTRKDNFGILEVKDAKLIEKQSFSGNN